MSVSPLLDPVFLVSLGGTALLYGLLHAALERIAGPHTHSYAVFKLSAFLPVASIFASSVLVFGEYALTETGIILGTMFVVDVFLDYYQTVMGTP